MLVVDRLELVSLWVVGLVLLLTPPLLAWIGVMDLGRIGESDKGLSCFLLLRFRLLRRSFPLVGLGRLGSLLLSSLDLCFGENEARLTRPTGAAVSSWFCLRNIFDLAK